MTYAIFVLVGFACGAVLVYFLVEAKRRALANWQDRLSLQQSQQQATAGELLQARQRFAEESDASRQHLANEAASLQSAKQRFERDTSERLAAEERRRASQTAALDKAIQDTERELADRRVTADRLIVAMRNAEERRLAELAANEERRLAELKSTEERRLAELKAAEEERIATRRRDLHAERAEFDARVVSYNELSRENRGLKRDLASLNQQWRKSVLDQRDLAARQASLEGQAKTLGVSYLRDQQKWTSASLNVSNFATCKKRLLDAIENLRGIGLTISPEEEQRLVEALTAEYERVVRASLEREEQARIRAQIREEQKRDKEVKRAIEQADREKALVEAALARALEAAHGQHSAEIEQLQAKLAEAEAKSLRAVSQAQLTKAGYVYVISNIGSFGEGMFKIGMTRRLEPQERVEELGDASVPFPFDVHMMISTTDAPTLENALHRAFRNRRVNRVNLRKEFFRVGLHEVAEVVKAHHGEVEYRADPEALEYRNSLQMSEEDLERLDEVFEEEEEQEPIGASEID